MSEVGSRILAFSEGPILIVSLLELYSGEVIETAFTPGIEFTEATIEEIAIDCPIALPLISAETLVLICSTICA